jgi:hypothetical protein
MQSSQYDANRDTSTLADADIAARIESFLANFRTQPSGMQMQGPEIEATELLLIGMARLLRSSGR